MSAFVKYTDVCVVRSPPHKNIKQATSSGLPSPSLPAIKIGCGFPPASQLEPMLDGLRNPFAKVGLNAPHLFGWVFGPIDDNFPFELGGRRKTKASLNEERARCWPLHMTWLFLTWFFFFFLFLAPPLPRGVPGDGQDCHFPKDIAGFGPIPARIR
jgi:hypothetical protein